MSKIIIEVQGHFVLQKQKWLKGKISYAPIKVDMNH